MDKLLHGEMFDVAFLDDEVVVQAHTSVELARYHVAAMVKTIATKTGDLLRLKLEKEIRGPLSKPDNAPTIAAAAIAPYVAVREKMDALMVKHEWRRAKDVAEFLESKKSTVV